MMRWTESFGFELKAELLRLRAGNFLGASDNAN